MTDSFTSTLKGLLETSRNRPWRMSSPYAGECFIYRSDDHTITCGYDGEVAYIDARLICTLVNAAPEILSVVEALKPFEELARDRVADDPAWAGHETLECLIDVRDLRAVLSALSALEGKS